MGFDLEGGRETATLSEPHNFGPVMVFRRSPTLPRKEPHAPDHRPSPAVARPLAPPRHSPAASRWRARARPTRSSSWPPPRAAGGSSTTTATSPTPAASAATRRFVIGTKVGSSDHRHAAALGPHARRRRRLLQRERQPAAVGRQQVRGVARPRRSASCTTTALTGLVRADAAGLPDRLGVDVQPRHLQRRRPARPEQPEHDARRQAAHDQRAVRDQGRDRRSPSSTTRPARSSSTAPAPARPGVYSVAYSMQEEGVPPAGAIADSGSVNRAWELAQREQDTAVTTAATPSARRRSPRDCTRV